MTWYNILQGQGSRQDQAHQQPVGQGGPDGDWWGYGVHVPKDSAGNEGLYGCITNASMHTCIHAMTYANAVHKYRRGNVFVVSWIETHEILSLGNFTVL